MISPSFNQALPNIFESSLLSTWPGSPRELKMFIEWNNKKKRMNDLLFWNSGNWSLLSSLNTHYPYKLHSRMQLEMEIRNTPGIWCRYLPGLSCQVPQSWSSFLILSLFKKKKKICFCSLTLVLVFSLLALDFYFSTWT